jgi:hypothetical protein
MKLYMFRTVPLSIMRSFALYTQQWYMSCSLRAGWDVPSWSCSQAVSKPVWHIPLLCVQWKISYDGQRNCPKHVEFHSKNKFEKVVHLVGFIIGNLTQCTVTWTSNSLYVMSACYKLWSVGVSCVCLLPPIPSSLFNAPDYILGLWLEHTMMLTHVTSLKCICIEESSCLGSDGV